MTRSTENVEDFIKQRRRWFQGLAKVSLYAPVRLRWRLSLGFNTILWALAPFATVYTIIHLFYGFSHPWWVTFLANYSFASFATLYLIGLKANLDESGVERIWKRVGWFIAQTILLPVFNVMEGIGVLAAIFKPTQGFHVVRK